MQTRQVAWSESQRDIILKALDLSLERLSPFMNSPDKNLKEKHAGYERLSKKLSAQKPDGDGMFRLDLDEDSAAMIKSAVVSFRAGAA